jgi:hypothetical protein
MPLGVATQLVGFLDGNLEAPLYKDEIMLDKAFELTMKAMSGEELTDDEKNYVRLRNAKYEIARYVYMEKMEHEGSKMVGFQFSPGKSFMDTPIIDIVNNLLEFNKAIKDGKVTRLDFGDALHNPPHAGKEKTTL